MNPEIRGIHHITAIAGDPQRNIDFYAGLLGLRLVKRTVNFDDPGAYHFYYGDETGRPGTILTFFSWPGSPQGRRGTGQVIAAAFAVPEASLDYWAERFKAHKVPFEEPLSRFGENSIAFYDPDGLQLEMTGVSGSGYGIPWREGPVPPEHAVRGLHSATLSEEGYERTAALLAETLGFRLGGQEENRFRYEAGTGGPRAIVDVVCLPAAPPGRIAAGTVHHIAWRTPDDEDQKAWRRRIAGLGYYVSPVLDRQYFRSIYFRETGGVLFEIATDPPGFTADEPSEALGQSLKLPPWLEANRRCIEADLPDIVLPGRESDFGRSSYNSPSK
ncbi:MAG: ring-cleaving dioxygenase [Armatimonadetes bacterium]|nr:ring-cleaving dioxygenase [Armatimonadota bacterium]